MLRTVYEREGRAEAEHSLQAMSIIQGRDVDDLSRGIAVEVGSKG